MCLSSHRAAFGSGTLYIKIRDTADTAIQHDTADTVDTAENTATIQHDTALPVHSPMPPAKPRYSSYDTAVVQTDTAVLVYRRGSEFERQSDHGSR